MKCGSLFCGGATEKRRKQINLSLYKQLRFCRKYAIILSAVEVGCFCFRSESCLNRG